MNTETNILKNEYETIVSKVFEKYKINFQNEYDISPNKPECLNEHLTYFKNIIFTRRFNPDKGFFWLSTDELMNRQFYAHLTSIKKNSFNNYTFLNRTIEGNRIDFKTDIIPEVYAGASWEFYCWLKAMSDKVDEKSNVNIEAESNDEIIIMPQSVDQTFTALEYAFFYYYNNIPYTKKIIASIALKHDLSAENLKNKKRQFLRENTDIDKMTKSRKRNIASCDLYEKMIPFLLEENKQKPIEKFNKLKERIISNEPYPLPDEQ